MRVVLDSGSIIVITAPIIQVIAPDRMFRRSVAFLLEAEGWRVCQFDALSAAAVATEVPDCCVVDEAVFPVGESPHIRLLDMRRPAVLLTGRRDCVPSSDVFQTVEKPILGAALIEAVRSFLPIDRPAHHETT